MSGMVPEELGTQKKRALLEAALRMQLDSLERPVSAPGQDWILFLDQLNPAVALYNISAAVQIQGELNVAALQRALSAIVQRHQSLRMVFQPAADGSFGCSLLKLDQVELPVTDVQLHPATERHQRAVAIANSESGYHFDAAKGPLFRFSLIRLDQQSHWLVAVVHHAVFDRWSMGVLLHELGELYAAYVTGSANSLPTLSYSFNQFARQQQAGAVEQLSYWKSALAGTLPVLELPTDRLPGVRSHKGAVCARCLPKELIEGLTALARREGATQFMALLAAYQLLLQRYTGQEEVVVGTPVANRNRVELEPLIGMFVNTVAIRTRCEPSATFRTLLGQVRESCLGAFSNADVPFPVVVRSLHGERPQGENPVFQTMFVVSNAPLALDLHGLHASIIEDLDTNPQFDLTLNVSHSDGEWWARFTYDTDVFAEATVSRMSQHFLNLLTAVVADPDQPVVQVPMLSEAERHQQVTLWNDTGHFFPTDLIHDIVAARAAQHPDAVAIVQDDEQLTYAELEVRANRVAAALAARGVHAGSIVGVCLNRSIGLVVTVLGVLKAGAAYIAMDPAHPVERLLHMLHDASAAVLITATALNERFADCAIPVLCSDDDLALSAGGPIDLAGADLLNQTAYIIFTSGSTGVPKGIMVTHRNLLNAVHWYIDFFELTADDHTSQFIGPGFDPVIFEIWATLAAGATLHVVDETTKYDSVRLRDWLIANRITVSLLTAQVAEALMPLAWPANVALRTVPAGADRVTGFPPPSLPFNLVNVYGPTETTVVSIAGLVPKLAHPVGLPSIGRPVFNTQIYLLDRYGQLVPVGVPGEIYIAGEGVAKGYVGRPDLTAERFVDNPFTPGTKMYRTGDVARYHPDGSLDYIGRNDDQVKIRGLRVELGEIEAVLQQHAAVQQCLVLVREDEPGDKQLVAYLVLHQPGEATVADIRQRVRECLPPYMMPAAFVVMPSFPLTPNSKVDRKALPKPVHSGTAGGGGAQDVSGTERKVADVWRQVLGAERIGSNDNFFDVGGHSLRLVQVQKLLLQELGAEIPLLELFQYPTVKSLAKRLDQLSGKEPDVPVYEAVKAERRVPDTGTPARDQAIAIIGLAGRFPGAPDLEQFWDNLQGGHESISRFTKEELAHEGIDPAIANDPHYVPAKGVLADYDLFDANFFGYPPREAETIDPQQRLFLECSWEALEQSGYVADTTSRRIGVFAGSSLSTYMLNNLLNNPEHIRKVGLYQTMVGNDNGFLATRVAYKLNLNGPAVSVQTACSTSLVAVHMACQSLRHGECDLALTGGASVQSPMKAGYIYQEGEIMSPTGSCRAFDAEAGGTVVGSGVGVVVLKRLNDALADGDTIHAVIRGSAINNDGAGKVGFTAPSVQGQAAVIEDALDAAGVDPDTITYVEAHGTGTVLGDPIEVAALTQAYRRRGVTRKAFCALGTVKPNIGHLDTAAGVAGLIKATLALKAGQIPPTVGFETANPKLNIEESPFYVNATLTPWVTTGPRRAGVSSFGVGGTNAHVILEEAPVPHLTPVDTDWKLLPVSARSPQALEASVAAIAAQLERNPAVNLSDVALTLQVGRAEFAHRCVLVGRTTADALVTLKERDAARLYRGEAATGREVTFMFPGQGTQYVNMGRELYDRYSVFRSHVDQCAELLKEWLGLDLRDVIYPAPGQAPHAAEPLNETALTQPALFVIDYALAQLWMSWGVQPRAMIGHSLGEYVAACLASVMSLPDALRLVAVRGRLMQQLEPGAMLAVSASEQALLPLLGPEVAIAAVNAPQATVVSGSETDIERLRVELERRGLQARRLHTSHAFHSAMMDPILAVFEQEVRQVKLAPPVLPYLSNVTGTWISANEAVDPAYWAKHLRQTVRFGEGVRLLAADPERLFLEVGPGRTLSALAKQNHPQADVLTSLRHTQDAVDDVAHLLLSLGRLWVAGADVSWSRVMADRPGRRIPLPTYAFERKRYWVSMPASRRSELATSDNPRSPETDEQQSPVPAGHDRPAEGALFVEPAEGVESLVAHVWQEVLGIERISREDNFFDLGGDSLMAARVTGKLREAFPVTVPVSLVLESSSVGALALQIEALLIEKLNSLSDDELTTQSR